ncbi:DUF7224 domain-containing protein [Streptomyces jumonjinensis]|uniref:DUF7224 domain-containing protein n=1 Tax=Streptomyces jumonjinensis TaxID=1945 RepID=UPI0037BDF7BA
MAPVLFWFGVQNTESVIKYWESATAQSLIVLGFVNAGCGACAAWESARIRRAQIDSWAPARSRLDIAWLHLAPVAVLGLLGVLTSLAVFSAAALGAPGIPNLAILFTAYTVVVSHIALGWIVGPLMPRALGAAAMLIFGYLWGFWPAAIGELPWLRHLNGQGFVVCCGLDQTASLRSMAATVLFSGGLITAALISTVLGRKHRKHTLYVAAATALGTFGSLVLAVPLEFQGVQARDPGLRTCTGERVQICVWPEQRDEQDDIVRWAQDAEQRLRTVGVTLTSRVEFGQPSPNESVVRATTATSVLPPAPPDCAMKPGAEYPGDAAHSAIYAWLSLTSGEPRGELVQHWQPEAVALADQIRQLPAEQQQAWYERNMQSVLDCSVKPDLRPASLQRVEEKQP